MSKAQLGRLIELPDDALQQILDYANTLSKADAADHFSNLLGSDPAAIEFVAAFNSRRHDPAAGSASSVAAAASRSASGANTPGTSSPGAIEPVPKHQRAKKKKAAPLHTPPPRQITSLAPPPGAVYNKKDIGDDYMGGRSSGATTPLAVAAAGIARGATPVSASTTPPPQPSPQKQPSPQPQALSQSQSQSQSQKQQRLGGGGGGGSLIQDALAPKSKNRSSKDTPSTKINITGGTAMHGAATALADFDAAIRSLEVSTNPTLAGSANGADKDGKDSVAARRCNCVATRHPLQTAAPNCQNCGKVICVKEGLGPCTSCGSPLLSPAEVQAMIKELRAERGREKMAADREAHRRIDVNYGGGRNRAGGAMTLAQHASGPHMIAGHTKWGGDDDGFVSLADAAKKAETEMQTAEAKARAHRDKLLAFQAQNAQRTTVRDEAADFDVGDAMVANGEDTPTSRNLWATPEERARELRRQQKLLREMEWNARPEYEKRQQVLSIDVTGRKVFRKTVAVERPPTPKSDEDEDNINDEYGYGGKGAAILTDADGNKDTGASNRTAAGGAFSKNPLLGHLIKPVYDAQSRAKAAEKEKAEKEREKEKEKGKGKEKDKSKEGEKDGGKSKGKGKAEAGKEKAESKKEEIASSSNDVSESSHLRGRSDNPKSASRWRRVQDDLDNNEAVILDGGIYGAGVQKSTLPVGDEPECG